MRESYLQRRKIQHSLQNETKQRIFASLLYSERLTLLKVPAFNGEMPPAATIALSKTSSIVLASLFLYLYTERHHMFFISESNLS
jgi:hypothetical protein